MGTKTKILAHIRAYIIWAKIWRRCCICNRSTDTKGITIFESFIQCEGAASLNSGKRNTKRHTWPEMWSFYWINPDVVSQQRTEANSKRLNDVNCITSIQRYPSMRANNGSEGGIEAMRMHSARIFQH